MNSQAFVMPSRRFWGQIVNAFANSRWLAGLRRALMARLPFPLLASDVTDVVYMNWVVPLAAVQSLVPPGVSLLSVSGNTVLTVLSYRHGHFGPALLGPLRRLFPSPLQSNWRLYVRQLPNGRTSEDVVLFIKNIFDSVLYAVGTRVASDALPSHVAERFSHERSGEVYRTQIDGGCGSAPGFSAEVALTQPLGAPAGLPSGSPAALPAEFAAFFKDWPDAVRRLCLQASAVAEVAGISQLAQAGIDLPIDPASVLAAVPRHFRAGDFLRDHGVTQAPFCFVVPQVPFRVLWERLI